MNKRETAAELMARLNADPNYRDRVARRKLERTKKAAELREAEAPLVAALNDAGVTVKSAWDLLRAGAPYPRALPILLEHLRRPYPAPVREGIARALAVREARFAWNVLTGMFRTERDKQVRDGLAVALAAIAEDDLIGDVISLAGDDALGSSRVLLLEALERSRDPRALGALRKLETDPDVCKEAKAILKRTEGKARRRARAPERLLGTERPERKASSLANLVEASTGLDADDLAPFLERVAKLVQSGFGSEEVRRIIELTEELDPKEEGELEFEVRHDGRVSPMKVRIFMSNADAPDLAIFAPDDLASQIREEMERFTDERGM